MITLQNKKNLFFISFLLLTGLKAGALYGSATLTDVERDHIHAISSSIKTASNFIVETLAKLIEKKYKNSYTQFVNDFDEMIDTFDKEVFRVIEKRLENTDPQTTFYQVNKEVYDLMSEFFVDIQKARECFDSYRGKPRESKTARDCLRSVEPHLRAIILSDAFASLETRLNKIYALLEQAGEQELIQEIKSVETSLRSLQDHPSFKNLSEQTLKLRLANVFAAMVTKGT